MPGPPWWVARVTELLEPSTVAAVALGRLWNLSEGIQFIRENVEPLLLRQDLAAQPDLSRIWSAFEERENEVRGALATAVDRLAFRVREGELGPAAFRTEWQELGFEPNARGGGTPADDFLDAMFQMPRLTLGEPRPPLGMPNISSRAHRVADFLDTVEPDRDDVLFDLGSGNGKLALTVAASTFARVRGVECGAAYVESAKRSADFFGLSQVEFLHADVRDVDLSEGTVFYLYHPFQGEVARDVAQSLGVLARHKDITIYSAGPRSGFGEHFLDEVESGALDVFEQRGEFGEVMVLRSRSHFQSRAERDTHRA